MFRPQRSVPIKPVRQAPLPVVQRTPVQPPLRADTIQRAQGNPGSLMPSDVQLLQRTMGNQAVARMVGQGSAAPVVQAKLRVGANNDPYEQEANRVAQQVVGQLHGDRPISALPAMGNVQRAGAEGSLGGKGGSLAQGGELSPQIAGQLQSARGGGQSLAAPVRSAMEQAFGADFSGVRIHQSQQADTLNRSIEARAFTSGQDLFFRKGEYDPSTPAGQGLLAHELTHVVQQSGGQLQRAHAKAAEGENAHGFSPHQRLPSAQRVMQSGRFLGQPQIAQRSPQGRIHRCGDDEPQPKTMPRTVSVKPTTGPVKSTGKTSGSKPINSKSDFGTKAPTKTSAPSLPSVHSGRDTGPAISAVNSSSLSSEYKARAIVLINNPNEASQAGYGICGLTSILRALLIHDPARFVTLAAAAAADGEMVTWRNFFQSKATPEQKEKELDYITAQFMLRKGGSGQVSQKVLKRNKTGGVDETNKTKDYGDVFKAQTNFSNSFPINGWEAAGHYATTAGGLNYLYSHVSGREGYKIKISDNFESDYNLAKAKAGTTGTVNASIKGHDFYKAGGAEIDNGPAEKHPAKYRHWVTIESLEKIAKANKSGKTDTYFKMKIWTYENYWEAMVNENVVGDYIHSLVVM